jgi:molybdenum cofactor synthesis domain-containing protein
MRVAILTISDRVSSGERQDRSGPELGTLIKNHGWQVVSRNVVSDDPSGIQSWLMEASDSGEIDLILTTGGTGMSPRDLAPEATRAVLEREAPGLVEAMRAASLQKTPHAMLSRAVAGIRSQTLIVNLPGSPQGARENLEVIMPVLEHAIALLREDPDAEAGHQLKSKPRHL